MNTEDGQVLDVPGTLGLPTAFTPERIWLPTSSQEGSARIATVAEVDIGAGRVTRMPAGEGVALAIAVSRSLVFVGFGNGEVRALLLTPTPVLSLSASVALLAVGEGKLWAIDSRGQMSLLNLRTNRVSANIARLPGRLGASAVVADGRLWVSGTSLVALNEQGSVQTIEMPGGPVTNVARCGGRIWTAQKNLGGEYGNSPGLRAANADGVVTRTVPASFPGYLACGGEYLWAATVDGQLYRLKVR
ncbi:MAG: hypothetical protein QM655_04305 [Nocardioidaceae bacterium]